MDMQEEVDLWGTFPASPSSIVRVGASFARRRLRAILLAKQSRRSPMTAKYLSEKDYSEFFDASKGSKLQQVIGKDHFTERLKRLGLNKTYVRPVGSRRESEHPVERWVESPLEFSKRLWNGIFRENDVEFFHHRSVCRAFGIPCSADTAGAYYALGRKLNELLEEALQVLQNTEPFHFVRGIRQPLLGTAETRVVDSFLECCFSNHLFEVHLTDEDTGCFVRPRGLADPEYLLSNLFSVPTASSGLNQLFGGSGPMMTLSAPRVSPATLPGRVMLASGRFGTGKSVLAQLLACEVAKKGGVAWYFSTEQSVAEVLYTLKTVTSGPSAGLKIITKVAEAIRFVDEEREQDEGTLIVLNMCDVKEQEVWDYLKFFSQRAIGRSNEASLRLAVIDSINAISHRSKEDSKPLRQSIFDGLEECTANGMNVLLLEELTDQTQYNDYRFVRNLADFVIELTVDSPSIESAHGYARRYIEILKSRFQRDQRGRHSFSIMPPDGLRVVPSIAAVRAKVGSRRIESREQPGGIGMPALDEILGKTPLYSGELNVLRGDQGTFKSALSAAFLNEATRGVTTRGATAHKDGNRRIGLLVSMRMSERDFYKPLSAVSNVAENSPLRDRVQVCRLPPGFVTPGEVLRLIEKEMISARCRNRTIARVVLDDVGEWPSFSPFIKDDASFGPTLLDFLSRYPLLVMATLNDRDTQHGGGLQEFFVENASRLIDLERFVHGGRQRALLRVINSPRMNHKRDAFELGMDHRGSLQIDTRPSLFEVSGGKTHSTAGVQLYLQTESLQQQSYNARIRDQLRAMMSPDVQIENPDHLDGVGNLSELGLSVVTTLQVLQIDGFRLHPSSRDRKLPQLHPLEPRPLTINLESRQQTCEATSAFLDRLKGRMFNTKQQLVAIPYYDNLSFLTGDTDRLSNAGFELDDLTWESIAEGCERVKVHESKTEQLFFDFPQGSDENLNCLFLEMLFQQRGSAANDLGELREFMFDTVGNSTMELFHRVASPAYQQHQKWKDPFGWSNQESNRKTGPDLRGPHRYSVCTNASVWRHWFTTYSQMMAFGGMDANGKFERIQFEKTGAIQLRSLPGSWTTAGEWYLCIPEHSAVPGAGNSIIELLISGAADRERFDLGVGLPVQKNAYSALQNGARNGGATSATELTLDFFQALQADPKVRRDSINGYSRFSPFLANWLRRLLNIHEFKADSPSSNTLMQVLGRIFDRTTPLDKKH